VVYQDGLAATFHGPGHGQFQMIAYDLKPIEGKMTFVEIYDNSPTYDIAVDHVMVVEP
jgi:hypothetical protein